MTDKTILVTGGAGFIGANLAISFKKKYPGREVVALDNLKRRGSELNLPRLKKQGIAFRHGDIRCPEDLDLKEKIGLLIECSAEPSVLAGFGDNPRYLVNTNLAGTVNCLELARAHKADIIFLSTSRVYPYDAINRIPARDAGTRFEWEHMPGIAEDFPLEGPRTLYGATKLASELLLQEYLRNYGLRGVINRCGVIAGPGQFGKVDQGVFTHWMLAHYFKKELNYIGFGGRGKQVRDLLHVDDLFRLIDIQAGMLNKISGRVYNVGGGRECSLSLLETTQLCRAISGRRIPVGRIIRNRPGDVRVYLTDNRKARQELGWRPRKTPREILEDIHAGLARNEDKIREALLER